MDASPLSKLPRELRDIIYTYSFYHEVGYIVLPDLNITKTCRQSRVESLPLSYSTPAYFFHGIYAYNIARDAHALLRIFSAVPLHCLSGIQELVIQVGWGPEVQDIQEWSIIFRTLAVTGLLRRTVLGAGMGKDHHIRLSERLEDVRPSHPALASNARQSFYFDFFKVILEMADRQCDEVQVWVDEQQADGKTIQEILRGSEIAVPSRAR
jgi:hypothetical protein